MKYKVRHIINAEDFINYEITNTLASTCDRFSSKRLVIITNISTNNVKYFVENSRNNKADYFLNLEDAINMYNQ